MANPVVGRDPEATGAEQKSSFGDILTQFEQAHASPAKSHGDGREGSVIAVTGDSVFVDIGMKIEGIVPAAEFRDKSGVVAFSRATSCASPSPDGTTKVTTCFPNSRCSVRRTGRVWKKLFRRSAPSPVLSAAW